MKEELNESAQTSDEVEYKLEDVNSVDANLCTELIAAKKDLEELRLNDLENKEKVEDAQKRDEKLTSKRFLCISQHELHMQGIQEICSLPPTNELNKYKSISISALMKQLESTDKELK